MSICFNAMNVDLVMRVVDSVKYCLTAMLFKKINASEAKVSPPAGGGDLEGAN